MEMLVYVHTARCMKPLLKNDNITFKVCTELRTKLHFSFPHDVSAFQATPLSDGQKITGTRSKDICFYNKPFYFIFSIFLYAHLL